MVVLTQDVLKIGFFLDFVEKKKFFFFFRGSKFFAELSHVAL